MTAAITSGLVVLVIFAALALDVAYDRHRRHYRPDRDAATSHAALLAELARHRDTSDDCPPHGIRRP